MSKRNWRDTAEIIGIASVVAGLILVAWEIRQANEIAKAQTVIELAGQYNEFNSARFENPVVADLILAMSDPDQSKVSETQKSMMAGAAWHFANIFWSAQLAHDSGLLNAEDIEVYKSSLGWMLKYMPGLRSEFINMYQTAPWARDAYVFEPLRDIACASVDDCDDAPANK